MCSEVRLLSINPLNVPATPPILIAADIALLLDLTALQFLLHAISRPYPRLQNAIVLEI